VAAYNGVTVSDRSRPPVEITWNAPAGQRPPLPNLWILAIGVNSYDNPQIRNLNFTVTDAKMLVQTLKQQEGRQYARVNSLIIADGEQLLPTTDNIRRNLAFLNQTGRRDTVILFLAGHGITAQENKFFFLPRDAVITDNGGSILVDERRAISGDEITAVLEGQGRRLLFIDACHSGGVDNDRMIRAMMRSNAFVFASSQGSEESYEHPNWGGGHGAFTYSILNALRGAPAALTEGNVSMRSMEGFVILNVPQLIRNTPGLPTGARQTPKAHTLLFADFPLAVIR